MDKSPVVTKGRAKRLGTEELVHARSSIKGPRAPATPTSARRTRRSRQTLAETVRDQLLSEIRGGQYHPGDQLPTEAELGARFEVSRAPIREAMHSLRLLGLVDISPRRGMTVRALPVESVVDLAILSAIMGPKRPVNDILEFRSAMDTAIAGLCARNASVEQMESIAAILKENVAAVRSGDRAMSSDADVRFHAAIAEASGNVVFQAVSRSMNELFVQLRRTLELVPNAAEAALLEHQAIYRAMLARDAPAARRAAGAHVKNVQARVLSDPSRTLRP